MASSIPPLGAPGGEGRSIEVSRLQAAVLEALSICGLQGLQEAFSVYMQGMNTRLIKQGIIDLSIVWQPLSDDESIPSQQAAKVLLLVYLYIESVLKVPVAVADKARPAMEAALASATDLDTVLPRMVQGVEARLKGTESARQGEGKEAPKPEAPKIEASKKEAPHREAFRVGPAHGKQRASVSSVQRWVLGVFAVLVLAGIAGYWGHFYLALKARQEEYEKSHIVPDQESLSRILPAIEARVVGNVLYIVAANDGFGKAPRAQQARTGELLLEALKAPFVTTVQVKSGEISIFIRKTAGGMRVMNYRTSQ